MKHRLARDLGAPVASVVAALHDLGRVDAWVGGLLEHRAEPQPDGTTDLSLRIRGPRTLTLRLSIERLPDGLRYALVEGDVSAAEGRIAVTATDTGSRVAWDHEVAFPVAVPRLLLHELDDRVFPEWIDRLGHVASRP